VRINRAEHPDLRAPGIGVDGGHGPQEGGQQGWYWVGAVQKRQEDRQTSVGQYLSQVALGTFVELIGHLSLVGLPVAREERGEGEEGNKYRPPDPSAEGEDDGAHGDGTRGAASRESAPPMSEQRDGGTQKQAGQQSE